MKRNYQPPAFFKRAGLAPAAILLLNMWGWHMIRAQGSNEYGQAYVAYDGMGNGYTASQLKIPALTGGSTPPAGMYPHSETCQAGFFTLYFMDVIEATGCGYDEYAPYPGGTVSLGQQRQSVVCQVYEDLSELINETPGTNVNIEMRGSESCIPILPPIGIAGSAPTLTSVPGSTPVTGVIRGNVWRAINGLPTSGGYEGFTRVRFSLDGLPSSTQQYFLEPGQPASGSGMMDFYTIILHEAMHLLGFISLITEDGSGGLFDGKYVLYDTFVSDGLGNHFLDISDIYNIVVSPGFQSTTIPLPALVSGCGNSPLVFEGNFNTSQVLFSPSSWGTGKMSHFNCPVPESACVMGANGYVMNSIHCADVEQRRPHQNEVYTLCDLGYSVSDTYGADLSNPHTYYNNYQKCQPDCIAVGANDEYTIPPLETYIDVTGVLNNDVFSSGTPSMENLAIGFGGGAISNVDNAAGSFTYTPDPNFFGNAILYYFPACDGTTGNMTKIRVHISPTFCHPFQTEPCELLCYGDFEDITDPSAAPFNAVNINLDETNSPDLHPEAGMAFGDPVPPEWFCGFPDNLPPPSVTAITNRYVGLAAFPDYRESLTFKLDDPLLAGRPYEITFDAFTGCEIELHFVFSEEVPCLTVPVNPAVGVTTACTLSAPYTPRFEHVFTVSPTTDPSGTLEWQQQSTQFVVPAAMSGFELDNVVIYGEGDGMGLYDNFSFRSELHCCLWQTPFAVTPSTVHPNVTTVDGRPAYVVDTGLNEWDYVTNDFIDDFGVLPGDPIYLDVDLVIPPDAELKMGGIEMYFAPNCRILVQKGQAPSSFGGILTLGAPEGDRSNLRGLCGAMWQGIQVEGPGTWTERVETANGNNYGRATLSGHLEIFDAIMGVAGMNLPLMDVFDLAYGMPWDEEFDPHNTEQTSIPFRSISAVGLGSYINSVSAQNSGGGVCQIGSYSRFSDCLQGVNLCWYKKNNTGAEQTELLGGALFSTKSGLKFPFSFDPDVIKSEAGVWLKYYNHIDIGGEDGNTFLNLKFGVRSTWTNNIFIRNNSISGCDSGVSLLGKASSLSPNVAVKVNQIDDCHVGMQAAAVDVHIAGNTISNSSMETLGVYLMGSEFVVDQCNQIYNTTYGTVLLNNGNLENELKDNLTFLNGLSVVSMGDNAGTQVYDNEFNTYMWAMAVADYVPMNSGTNPPTTGVFSNQGECNFPIGPADNIFVNPLDAVDILSTIPTPFDYRHRANDATYTFNPNISGSVSKTLCDPLLIPTPSLDCLSSQQMMSGGGGEGVMAMAASPSGTGQAGGRPPSMSAELRRLLAGGNRAAAVSLLQSSNTAYAREKLLQHHLEQNNFGAFFGLLDQVPGTSPSGMEMKRLYQLYGTLKMEGREAYELTPGEEAVVREVAAGNTRWVYEARAILNLAYNEEYPVDLPPISDFVDEAALGQLIGYKKGVKMGADKAVSIFPNPANTHLHVQLHDDVGNAVFELYDLNGKLLKRTELTGDAQVSTVDLPSGIYLHTVTAANGTTLAKGKTVIIH